MWPDLGIFTTVVLRLSTLVERSLLKMIPGDRVATRDKFLKLKGDESW